MSIRKERSENEQDYRYYFTYDGYGNEVDAPDAVVMLQQRQTEAIERIASVTETFLRRMSANAGLARKAT